MELISTSSSFPGSGLDILERERRNEEDECFGVEFLEGRVSPPPPEDCILRVCL